MEIRKIQLENFTVFEKLDIKFESGVNVLVGENGMGKTHIMKLLYSACQATKHDVSLSQKLYECFILMVLTYSVWSQEKIWEGWQA